MRIPRVRCSSHGDGERNGIQKDGPSEADRLWLGAMILLPQKGGYVVVKPRRSHWQIYVRSRNWQSNAYRKRNNVPRKSSGDCKDPVWQSNGLSGSEVPDRSNHFNPIFDKLVNVEQPQVAEMVAYCLYKIGKREWATDFFAKNGRKPNDEELAAYVATWTPSLIENTRQQATGIVNSFAASVLDENAPKIREDALRGTFLRCCRHLNCSVISLHASPDRCRHRWADCRR